MSLKPSEDVEMPTSPPPRPLYMQVATAIKDELLAGIHPVGAVLPSEGELAKRFSVSRHTVRESLRRLREERLVASKQGAGTVVLVPPSVAPEIQQVMSIGGLLAFANDTRLGIQHISMLTLDDELVARTGLGVAEEWLVVTGFRYSSEGGSPCCCTEYYINRNYASVGRILPRHQGAIFPLLEDMFGLSVVEVEQQISACLASGEMAAKLCVDAGTAALEVRRTYKTVESEVVQVTINTHPASRFQHAMTMRRVKA
ncbi:GntR family transcriptional regulator [Zhongshania aquimaris]|uniref:GntR family transcriptional regulator n=1 Tax=Zhongshania aquimaris TaxID=2857107 RepID=A0ABS6VWD4_9GAMM|nr:GntR family transcriptional regulator [Zhongshania aquimaris]MBW2942675.1 GntR family transcriptional regulator [Zhongshania aquimaris]